VFHSASAPGLAADMGLLRRSGQTGLICESPRILVVDDLATPDQCAHIIELASTGLKSAEVVGEDASDVMMSKRSASVAWVEPRQTPIVAALADQVAALAELPARTIESMQVVKYEVGDQHTFHFDTFDPNETGASRHLRNGGQRIKTGLLYLAAPSIGGSTAFPNVKARVKPKAGRLVLFDTVMPGTTTPHPDAIHSGMPVVRGQKWACNFWFRERQPPKKSGRTGGKSRSRKKRR